MPLAQRLARRRRALAQAQHAFSKAMARAAAADVESEEANAAAAGARTLADETASDTEEEEAAASTAAHRMVATEAMREVEDEEALAVRVAGAQLARLAAEEAENDERMAVRGAARLLARAATAEVESDEASAVLSAHEQASQLSQVVAVGHPMKAAPSEPSTRQAVRAVDAEESTAKILPVGKQAVAAAAADVVALKGLLQKLAIRRAGAQVGSSDYASVVGVELAQRPALLSAGVPAQLLAKVSSMNSSISVPT